MGKEEEITKKAATSSELLVSLDFIKTIEFLRPQTSLRMCASSMPVVLLTLARGPLAAVNGWLAVVGAVHGREGPSRANWEQENDAFMIFIYIIIRAL